MLLTKTHNPSIYKRILNLMDHSEERQAEASSLVLEVPRPLAPISPRSRPHLAPILTTAAARVLLEVDNRAPYLAGRHDR